MRTMYSLNRIGSFLLILALAAPSPLCADPLPRTNDPTESASATLARNIAALKQEQQALLQRQTLELSRSYFSAAPQVKTPIGAVLGTGSLTWLSGQKKSSSTGIRPVAGRQGLLVSYSVPVGDPMSFLRWRSWTYDDAMGAMALLLQGRTQDARTVLSALQGLMKSDGSLGFSYQVDSTYADNRVRTGTVAWVGYAMAFYERVTGDKRFESSAVAIAKKLKGLQVSSGSLRGGPDVNWASTEHNLDAWNFFDLLCRVTGKAEYRATADQIKNSLLTNHWTGGTSGHFQQGIGDPAAALDANALGALFLNAIGRADLAASAMNYIEATFANSKTISGSTKTVTGYSPDASRKTVWVEGTLTVARAYQLLGNTAKVNSILQSVGTIQDVWTAQGRWKGALPYAVGRYVNPDGDTFTEFEAVPSTSWFLLAQSVQNGDSRFLDRG